MPNFEINSTNTCFFQQGFQWERPNKMILWRRDAKKGRRLIKENATRKPALWSGVMGRFWCISALSPFHFCSRQSGAWTCTNFERLILAGGRLHPACSRGVSRDNPNGLAFCYSGSNVFWIVNVIEHLPSTIKVKMFSPGFIISQVYSVKAEMKYMGIMAVYN